MITFATPDGGELAGDVITSAAADGTVRLTVDIDPHGWERVHRGTWFHLDPEHAGDGFPSSADPAAYRLVLRLDDSIATKLLSDTTIDALAAQLRDGPDDGPLRDSNNWYAEDVQRELSVPEELSAPGVRLAEGYSTGWARSGASVGRLVDVAREWLTQQGFQPQEIEGNTLLRLDGDGANGSWVLWVETKEEADLIRVFSSWPEGVPEERRPAMMEFITRLNPDLLIGAFELDLDRGQVSFRTGVDLGGDPLTPGVMSGLIRTNVSTFDDFLPAIQAVIEGRDTVVTHTVTTT